MLELLPTILNTAFVVLRVVVVEVGLKGKPKVYTLPVPLLPFDRISINERPVLGQSLCFIPSHTRRFIVGGTNSSAIISAAENPPA